MKTNPLEDLLAAYSKQPLPPARGPGTSAIWQEIENRRRRSFWARFLPSLEWRELFLEPRLAGAALALAIIMGLVPGYFVVSRTYNEVQMARSSLHFGVFSASSADVLSSPQTYTKL